MRLTNTDQISGGDRQASGSQPDNSTPTGTTASGVVPPGTGTVTSIAGGSEMDLTPDPITTAGTVNLATVGTAGNYQRATTNAYGRVSSGQNDVINVKQYGMDPANSKAANTTAWNLAVAALQSYGTFYIPAGQYPITEGGLVAFTGLTGITICGDGWSSELYGDATGAPSNFIVVDESCDHVTVRDLALVGSATVRGSGILLRFYASHSDIYGCYFKGSSDFAVHISGNAAETAYSQTVSFCLNTIDGPLGDGVHVGATKDSLVQGNNILNTGDDSIAFVSPSDAFPTVRGYAVGNKIYNAGARGIAILETQGFQCVGNEVWVSVLAGIEANRNLSTTAYNTNGKISANKLYGTTTGAGPIGNINLFFCDTVECSNNLIDTPATGSGISFLDVLSVAITGNTMKGIPAYGIRGYDFGASNVAATQGPLSISRNVVFDCADYAIYCVADTGATIYNFMLNGNEAYDVSGSATAVFWNKVDTGRVYNNVSLGFAYTAGGTVASVTTGSNI